MRLVYTHNGNSVEIGDICTLSDNEEVEVCGVQEPHKSSSTGRVYVKTPGNREEGSSMAYFPGVIGAEWVDREDHV